MWYVKVCLAHKFECILLNFGYLQRGLKLLLVLYKEPIKVYRMEES